MDDQPVITGRGKMPVEIARAIIEIQKDIEPLTKSSANSEYGSKFAPLPEVMTYALAALTLNDLGLTQSPVTDENGHAALETTLIHVSGVSYSRTTKLALLERNINPQGHGSAITYMRRYSLMSMLGLTSEDDDDDANSGAGKERPATEAQMIDLRKMLMHLKMPKEEVAKEIYAARYYNQAALAITNYRKIVAQRTTDTEAAERSTKIEVGTGSIEDGPIVDESSPVATLNARIKALGLTKDGENKFVVNATDKPWFKIKKDQKPEDLKALDNALVAVESGVRALPGDWVAATTENTIVDAEYSDPQT
jgi:hypothetical protein